MNKFWMLTSLMNLIDNGIEDEQVSEVKLGVGKDLQDPKPHSV